MVPPSVYHGLAAVKALSRGRTVARETTPVTTIPHVYVEAVLPFLSRQVGALIELQSITGARCGELFAGGQGGGAFQSLRWVHEGQVQLKSQE